MKERTQAQNWRVQAQEQDFNVNKTQAELQDKNNPEELAGKKGWNIQLHLCQT